MLIGCRVRIVYLIFLRYGLPGQWMNFCRLYLQILSWWNTWTLLPKIENNSGWPSLSCSPSWFFSLPALLRIRRQLQNRWLHLPIGLYIFRGLWWPSFILILAYLLTRFVQRRCTLYWYITNHVTFMLRRTFLFIMLRLIQYFSWCLLKVESYSY